MIYTLIPVCFILFCLFRLERFDNTILKEKNSLLLEYIDGENVDLWRTIEQKRKSKFIKCSSCDNEATAYCILGFEDYACDEHATGDYHRELNEN